MTKDFSRKFNKQKRYYARHTIERLNAFIDAVLAIVATIMVLELQLPSKGMDNWQQLLPVVGGVAVFLISFVVVVDQYLANMRIFNVIEKISPTAVLLVFSWLVVLALLPFFTRWMLEDWHNRFAILGYGVVYVLASVLQQFLLLRVVKDNFNPNQIDTPENNALARLYNFAFSNQAKAALIGSAFLLIVAIVWPTWGFWLFIIVPVISFLETIYDGELKDRITGEQSRFQKHEMQVENQDDASSGSKEVPETFPNVDWQTIRNQERLRRNLYWKQLKDNQRKMAEERFYQWANLTPEQRQAERQKRRGDFRQ